MAGYDGKTCAGCDDTMFGASALLFNARNRFPEAEMVPKLWDCRQLYPALPAPDATAHPAIHAMHAVYVKLMQAMEGVVQDNTVIRWVPGVLQRIRNLEPEWTDALVAYETIKEEHRRDERHCRGELNWLRESRGSEHTLWGRRTDTSYHRHVAWVGQDEPHNIIHTTCGTRLALADYFLERMREDPTFYGKASCPACKAHMVPFSEFEIVSLDRINHDRSR